MQDSVVPYEGEKLGDLPIFDITMAYHPSKHLKWNDTFILAFRVYKNNTAKESHIKLILHSNEKKP